MKPEEKPTFGSHHVRKQNWIILSTRVQRRIKKKGAYKNRFNMHSCTDLPLVLPGSPLFSPPQACNPPPTSTTPTPLPRVTTTHPVQLIPLRQRCQIIVLLWSRIPGCWPRPARRSTHSRPRRASTLSPLPPLLFLETQLPVLTMLLCSSLCHFCSLRRLGGLGGPHSSMPRVSGGPRLPI